MPSPFFAVELGNSTSQSAVSSSGMFRRRSLRLLLLFVAAYLLLCSAAGLFIAEATLHPARRPLLDADKTQAATMAQRHDAQLTEAALSAFAGNTLRAWQLRPAHDNGDAVILLHGLSDNRMGMMGYAEMLITRGFTVLLPDARAHGASGGDTATFGLLESRDIRDWMDWMQDHDHPRCIFGLGESMGAALLLQSLKGQPEFCAVVAESPFSDFREIAYDRVGQYFRTGPWLGRSLLRPIVEIAFTYAQCKIRVRSRKGVTPSGTLADTHPCTVDTRPARRQHPGPPLSRHRFPQSRRHFVGGTRRRSLRRHQRCARRFPAKNRRIVYQPCGRESRPSAQLNFFRPSGSHIPASFPYSFQTPFRG
jgi:uncharacterized protein